MLELPCRAGGRFSAARRCGQLRECEVVSAASNPMLAASTLLEAVQAPPEFWTKVRFAQLDMEQNRADRRFQHSTCSLVLFFVSSSQEATAEGREKPERRGTHLISMILSSPLLLEQDAPIVETLVDGPFSVVSINHYFIFILIFIK